MLNHRILIPHCALLLAVISVPSALDAAPLAITRVKDLSFGRFVGGGGYSGTVTVDTSGARSSSGSVLLLSGEAVSPAQFSITGNPGARYVVTLPATVLLAAGGAQISMSGVTASIPAAGVLPSQGSTTFFVGATLAVGAGQVNGIYSGTFDVSVKNN